MISADLNLFFAFQAEKRSDEDVEEGGEKNKNKQNAFGVLCGQYCDKICEGKAVLSRAQDKMKIHACTIKTSQKCMW